MKKKNSKLSDTIRGVDAFSENVQFTFDEGKSQFKTALGGTCTIVMLFIVLAYAALQWLLIIQHEDASVSSHLDFKAIPQTEKYGQDQNLTFAFGTVSDLNPDLGTLRAYYFSYRNDSAVASYEEISTRTCKMSDFDGSGPLEKASEEDLLMIEEALQNLKCIDQELSMFGDYNTASS